MGGTTDDRNDPRLREIDKRGMQRAYLVLSDEERAKGFVRSFRRTYVHTACGQRTTMSDDIAATYARDPYFYGGTYCATCRTHYPVGPEGEFLWVDMSGRTTDEKVGT